MIKPAKVKKKSKKKKAIRLIAKEVLEIYLGTGETRTPKKPHKHDPRNFCTANTPLMFFTYKI